MECCDKKRTAYATLKKDSKSEKKQCDIKIKDIYGIGAENELVERIIVQGTAEECSSVRVILYCDNMNDPCITTEKNVENSLWKAVFEAPEDWPWSRFCDQSSVKIEVVNVEDDRCRDVLALATLRCESSDCPEEVEIKVAEISDCRDSKRKFRFYATVNSSHLPICRCYWSFGDGSTLVNPANPLEVEHIYDTSNTTNCGVKKVTLDIDCDYCEKIHGMVEVDVEPCQPPKISEVQIDICEKIDQENKWEVTLTPKMDEKYPQPVSYFWIFDNNTHSTQKQVKMKYCFAGIYGGTLIVSGPGNFEDEKIFWFDLIDYTDKDEFKRSIKVESDNEYEKELVAVDGSQKFNIKESIINAWKSFKSS